MPHATPTFDEFRQQMTDAGYDEVLERRWDPNAVAPSHTHPFEANAIVTQGEMWLDVTGHEVQHLDAGDRFHVMPHVVHNERYGADGATIWVARKHGAAATAAH